MTSPLAPRTLLLSPPSLSSHPEKLNIVLASHDRAATDIQMLDRLSLSLVSLPEATYDIILVLTDADSTRAESKRLLSRDVLAKLVRALKPGGKLQSQNGAFATEDEQERREAIFAGLIVEGPDLVKPDYEPTQSVPLLFGKSQGGAAAVTSAAGTGAVSLNLNGKRKNGPSESTAPNGVGYVDFGDDFGTPEVDGSDDDLIDEDTLLDEEDLKRPVFQRMYILFPSIANPRLFYLIGLNDYSARMPSKNR